MLGKSSWNGTRPRPKYLNLFQIRLPVPGLISIMHRGSGAVLFLFIPLLLMLFELSLESPQTFLRFKAVFSYWAFKLVLISLIWAYLHHLFAGIRHLALDLHYGIGLPAARASSWVVLVGAIVLTAVIGVKLW
jgi:succinate dehydrogenase / fumarate reductase cytochrome b subunit